VSGGRAGAAPAILGAAHPGPSAVVTAVALGLALSAGLALPRALLLVAAVLAGQLSIGWANDWIDAVRGVDAGRPDKPVATGALPVGRVRAAALAALAVCAVLSAALGPAPALVHLAAVASGWAYDLRLKSTVLSPLPYVLAFGLLPSVATTAAGSGLAPAWAAGVGACFGAGVHVANVLPDLEVDAAAGVRGLPQRLGARGSVVATVLLLGLGTATVLLGPGVPPAGARRVVVAVGAVAAAGALVLVGVDGARGRRERAYRGAMACGLLVVGLLLARGDALT
jgi:4-hydroxybenzoate polyprenyltransferase